MLVAPLAGSVDRNGLPLPLVPVPVVAPLAGSVDRNFRDKVEEYMALWWSLPSRGAWIEIGLEFSRRTVVGESLPSRGAWIEIKPNCFALLMVAMSLPSRGAWIEMLEIKSNIDCEKSLPSRGAWIEIVNSLPLRAYARGRSPRGERG